MPWIEHPVRLSGTLIRLEPLNETHFQELVRSGSDPKIWTHLPFDGSDAVKLYRELGSAVLQRTGGSQYPFTIIRQRDDKIIGSTRLFDIFPEHRKVEIGWTWYNPEVWGRGYNLEAKLLLLRYLFDTLQANRVQLKTRDTNLRSMAAIKKIGGIYEGLLRNDRVLPDGSVRNTVVYSIIREEWPAVSAHLTELVNKVVGRD
jgi:RimJ/RimL family protein N-acetyltransferase